MNRMVLDSLMGAKEGAVVSESGGCYMRRLILNSLLENQDGAADFGKNILGIAARTYVNPNWRATARQIPLVGRLIKNPTHEERMAAVKKKVGGKLRDKSPFYRRLEKKAKELGVVESYRPVIDAAMDSFFPDPESPETKRKKWIKRAAKTAVAGTALYAGVKGAARGPERAGYKSSLGGAKKYLRHGWRTGEWGALT